MNLRHMVSGAACLLAAAALSVTAGGAMAAPENADDGSDASGASVATQTESTEQSETTEQAETTDTTESTASEPATTESSTTEPAPTETGDDESSEATTPDESTESSTSETSATTPTDSTSSSSPSEPTDSDSSPVQIKVPKVIGEQQDEATTILQQQGFNVKPEYKVSDNGEAPGTVTAQNPKAGETYEVGKTVTITVAETKGTMADYKDQDSGTVTKELEGKGYTVKPESESSSVVAKDRVIRTNPKAGDPLTALQTITLYVSTGPDDGEPGGGGSTDPTDPSDPSSPSDPDDPTSDDPMDEPTSDDPTTTEPSQTPTETPTMEQREARPSSEATPDPGETESSSTTPTPTSTPYESSSTESAAAAVPTESSPPPTQRTKQGPIPLIDQSAGDDQALVVAMPWMDSTDSFAQIRLVVFGTLALAGLATALTAGSMWRSSRRDLAALRGKLPGTK